MGNQPRDLSPTDRLIINALQGGFPLCDFPYAEAAHRLGLSEGELLNHLQDLLNRGILTRFGPLWNADAWGGCNLLAAMTVPEDRFDAVADIVNAFPEVAHNYAREHALNMWFVIATETKEQASAVCERITAATGLEILPMPKLHEFALEVRFHV